MFQLVCKKLILKLIQFSRKHSFKSNKNFENVSIIFKIRKARKSNVLQQLRFQLRYKPVWITY
jgi:hypothetical protein